LKGICAVDSRWGGEKGKKASSERAAYLFNKILIAERKIEALEKQNTELKTVLALGHRNTSHGTTWFISDYFSSWFR
jgi:hypothetical protein